MWHGWADGSIVATTSIGYYKGVMKFMGDRKQTEDFFRLFLVPGVHHVGGGPGLTEFDALTALENWVERGEAPVRLIASRSATAPSNAPGLSSHIRFWLITLERAIRKRRTVSCPSILPNPNRISRHERPARTTHIPDVLSATLPLQH
jgi:hypothetical protein